MIEKYLLGESKYIEYKQAYTSTFLKTVSAFANYHDGVIIFGVTDKGEVVGVKNPEDTRLQIENAINDGLDPVPYVEIEKVMIESNTVLLVNVFKGDHTPYLLKQKTYRRTDTSTVAVDRFAYEELILQGRNSSFEELVAAEQALTFQDLEKKLKKEIGINTLTEDLLITLRLKKDGKYTHAAALLSDENPMESARIQLIAYRDNTVMSIKDRQILDSISLVKQYDECLLFYRKHLNVGETIEGPYRKTVEEIPLVAYREAIANMIVHRNYARSEEARVEVFADRVEIFSPGGLPIGISKEEYVQGRISLPRNQIVADVFYRLKIIEKLATGIRRIREYYRDAMVKPVFHVSENSILVVLPRIQPVQEVKDSMGKTSYGQMSEKEKTIYQLIETKGPIARGNIEKEIGLGKSQTIELINQLRSHGLVTTIGQGRSTQYIITKVT